MFNLRQFLNCLVTLVCLIWFNSVTAKELTLATSMSIPPYIIEHNDSGIQLERVKKAFELANHSIKKVIYTSNKRAEILLYQTKVDAIINAPNNSKSMHFSDPVIYYQNVAISLTSNHLYLTNISGLSNVRVMAFQNARKYLGDDYRLAVNQSPAYDEAINQQAQLEHLFLKHTDVIILDRRIFDHFNKLFEASGRFPKPVTFHPIFPKSPRVLGFHSKALRDDFNEGLKRLDEALKHSEP